MKIHPVGAEYFDAYGWTNMVKLIVAFRNFTKAPKNRLSFFFFFVNLYVCCCISASEVSIEPPCLSLLQVGLVILYEEFLSYCLVLLTMKGSNYVFVKHCNTLKH